MGDAVSMALNENPVPMKRIGVEDRFGGSGKPEELLAAYGPDGASIAEQVGQFVRG